MYSQHNSTKHSTSGEVTNCSMQQEIVFYIYWFIIMFTRISLCSQGCGPQLSCSQVYHHVHKTVGLNRHVHKSTSLNHHVHKSIIMFTRLWASIVMFTSLSLCSQDCGPQPSRSQVYKPQSSCSQVYHYVHRTVGLNGHVHKYTSLNHHVHKTMIKLSQTLELIFNIKCLSGSKNL